MWEVGTLEYNGTTYEYAVKVYTIDSELGIDNGKIVKLFVDKNGECIIQYERGWDIYPEDEQDEAVIDEIIKLFA